MPAAEVQLMLHRALSLPLLTCLAACVAAEPALEELEGSGFGSFEIGAGLDDDFVLGFSPSSATCVEVAMHDWAGSLAADAGPRATALRITIEDDDGNELAARTGVATTTQVLATSVVLRDDEPAPVLIRIANPTGQGTARGTVWLRAEPERPCELTAGKRADGAIAIHWESAASALLPFRVERSADGIGWSEVAACNRIGTLGSYDCADPTPVAGRVNLYRACRTRSGAVGADPRCTTATATPPVTVDLR